TNFKSVVLAAGAFFVTNGAGAIYITFMVTYGSKILKVPASTMLNGILWGAVAMGVTILVAGWLSDRFGRLPVYLAGAAFVGLMAFPVFWLVDTKSPVFIALALAINSVVLTSCMVHRRLSLANYLMQMSTIMKHRSVTRYPRSSLDSHH